MLNILQVILWFIDLHIGLVTLVVGFFVIYLYVHQKNDTKRSSASLILQEIRYAEKQIQNAKKNNYNFYLADKLLPTSSWHSNINLFIKDLKESEIDLVSEFYCHAAYLDVVIEKISNKKNDIIIPVQSGIGSDGIPVKPNLIQFELNSNQILKDVAEKINFIYNTPAVDRLCIISERKYWLIF